MLIKLFSNYDTSQGLLNRFSANYGFEDNLLQFTTGQVYDYAVVLNRTYDTINPCAKVITIIQEPSWNRHLLPTDFLEGSDYIFVHDQQLFEDTYQIKLGGKVIESPSLMFYHDPVDRSFFENTVPARKEKKLSMVVSAMYRPVGIYDKRLQLVEKILDSDLDIDIYGRGLHIDDRRVKGPLHYKFSGLLPYEYSIAIENSRERNYVTEKFVDCVLCNTIPLYCGAPNINEIYDARYFIPLDLDSPSIIEDIKKLIEPTPSPSERNKQLYFSKYNLYSILKQLLLEEEIHQKHS
jgi:hypothetical protein